MLEGQRCGLTYIYRLVDFVTHELEEPALPGLVAAALQLGFNGLAVTHPFKTSIIAHLSDLSDDARELAAVNTVLFKGGRSIGHNTDWVGFFESFRRDLGTVAKRRVVQLGAGGAGKAVAHAMLSCGVGHVALWVRDREKARPIAKSLAVRHGADRVSIVADLAGEVATADGLVNATPIGMDAYPGCPLSTTLLRADLWVADLIYSPAETALLKVARAIGAKTINGSGMFVFQAAEQFRLFTGSEPDIGRMQDHISQLMSEQRP
jgi:shikimate dehydrogenase